MVLSNNSAKVVAILVGVLGIVVMLGWILGIPVLTSILPQWVTMKFTTALAFSLSGVILFVLTRCKDQVGFGSFLTLSFSSLVLFGLVLLLLFSALFGFGAGIENTFVPEAEGAVATVEPGLPSLGTLIAFMLVAFTGMLSAIELNSIHRVYKFFGGIVFVIGVCAIGGYALHIPALYFAVEGVSTAMAIHTALAFVLLGFGMYAVSRSHGNGENKEQVIDTLETSL